jgi:hypothetical protein
MELRPSVLARPVGRAMRRRLGTSIVLFGLMAAVLLPFAATEVSAVTVDATPTWPIPLDVAAGPPAIPSMPAAAETAPSADQIADPVTPGATCTDWSLQASYGNRWVAGSTWWEYRCSHEDAQYHNTCAGPACDAFCPSCYWETQVWTDYFVWDGSDARFYGEAYSDSYAYDSDWSGSSTYWWDGATAGWYALGPDSLVVAKAGTGSGIVTSSPAGIDCGYVQSTQTNWPCQATFDVGTEVTLTATAGASSVFAGWSGDCSGTGTCQVTIDEANSVTATFTLIQASLTVSKIGSGSGLVASSPSGISCGTACQASFDAGTLVALTATPDAGSMFVGWSGDCSGTGSCAVTMDQSRGVLAAFTQIVYRPDALIQLPSTSLWAGDDVYSATATGETASSTGSRGTATTFYVAAQNDGNVADAVSVVGPGSVKGFSVHYYDGVTDVTTSVVAGTYSTGVLSPGASRTLRMTIDIGHNARPGTVESWLVSVTSHGVADAVIASVSVR